MTENKNNNLNISVSKTDTDQHNITAAWDKMAEHYDTFHPHTEEADAVIRNIICGKVKTNGKVLDVGTGTGYLVELCCKAGFDCIGIDVSKKMIDIARSRAAERQLKIEYLLFDGENYPINNNSFDAIVSCRVLWTIIHPKKVLDEWYRILKENGVVISFTKIGNNRGYSKSKKLCYGDKVDYKKFVFKYCSAEELKDYFVRSGFSNVRLIKIDPDKEDSAFCLICNK